MKIRMSWLALALLLLLPAVASAQRASGVGFEMGFRTFTPADARISETASTFRLNIQADPNLQLFVHREHAAFSFKNTGLGATAVPGTSDIEGIGLGYTLKDTFRLELMLGHGVTFTNNGNLASSDPVTDLGIVYLYKTQSGAFIDAGLILRTHALSGQVAGNAMGGGGTSIKPVSDLGGTILHLGIGLAL